jgi:hypothetical protein
VKKRLVLGIAGGAMLAQMVGAGLAFADGAPPPPPPSVIKLLNDKSAAEAPKVKPTEAATQAANPGMEVPATRAAGTDEGSKLAAAVPSDSVAVPAAQWLTEDVGPVTTRPAESDAVEPIQVPQPAAPAAVPTPETAPVKPAVAASPEVTEPKTVPAAAAPAMADAPVEPGQTSPEAAPAVAQAPASAAPVAPATPVAPAAIVETPKIVSITADYSGGERNSAEPQMKGPSSLQIENIPGDPAHRFSLVWIDGGQHSGDTFVRFFKPKKIFFATGKDCLSWARNEAMAGHAISPEGKQPAEIAAGCFANDETNEFWTWRQRSGAFSKSVIDPETIALYKSIVMQWSVSSPLAYGEFPETPYAGQ